MLWVYITRYRISFSFAFFILFSLVNVLWHKNPLAKASFVANRLAEQSSYVLKSLISMPFVAVQRVFEYGELKQKYEKALAEIEKYKAQKELYELLKEENQKLRALLNFEPLTEYAEEKAQVLGIRLSAITPRLIINKGENHGIKPFMPVIGIATDENQNPIRAVVGIVAKVQKNSSIVKPIHHPQSKIGVKIEKTNQWGILEGGTFSVDRLKLRYISSYVSKNDTLFADTYQEIQSSRLVTSGNEGIFPPNIPVGYVISRVEYDEDNIATAYARPYILIDRIDYVIVLKKEPEDWKNKLEDEQEKPLPFLEETEFITASLLEKYRQEQAQKEKIQNHSRITNKRVEEQKTDGQNSEKDNPGIQHVIINPNDPLLD